MMLIDNYVLFSRINKDDGDMRNSAQLLRSMSCSFSHVVQKKHVSYMIFVLFLFISLSFNPIAVSVYVTRTPELTILNPVGGEPYNDTVHIQWRVTDFDQGMRMYVYYKNTKETLWTRINDEAITHDDAEYLWSTNALEDGYYQLLVELVTAANYVIHEKSDEFLLDNDNADLHIDDIWITNMESSLYNAVKNGDAIQITATIQHAGAVTLKDVTADLDSVGGAEQVYPDTFDGTHAVWNISSVRCDVSDGVIPISINVLDIEQRTISLLVDNTKPQIEILKPAHGLYMFNKNIFPLLPSKSIVIGDIEVDIGITEENSIVHSEIYIDNILQHSYDGELSNWWLNTRIFGTHQIRVLVTDGAGNSAEASTICVFVNFF